MSFRSLRCFVSAPWLGLAVLVATSAPSAATVEYARREHAECGYCHSNGSPGYADPQTGNVLPASLNSRGDYYQMHRHSFEGYVGSEAVPAPKKLNPIFHVTWLEDMDEHTRRVGVGDLAGDGKPHLVTLSEAPGQVNGAVLTIRKWDGASFVTEFQKSIAAPADRLVVGRFAGKNKPAVIVVGNGLWYRSGQTYVSRPSQESLPLFGTSRLKDGSDRLLISESASDIRSCVVDPTLSRWLINTGHVPKSSEVSWGDMHAAPQFFSRIFPSSASGFTAGGLLGVWDSHKYPTPIIYYVKVDQDFDVRSDPDHPRSYTPKVTLKGLASYLLFRDPASGQALDLWSTPRLPGAIYDVIWDSPRSATESGFAVLTSASLTGKGRSLFFFALD